VERTFFSNFWKIFVLLIVLLGLLVGFFICFKNNKIEILNPLGRKKPIVLQQKKYKVMGFLPTWMIGKTMQYTNEIDKLVFLGIGVNKNGNLIWDFQAKKIYSDEYQKLKESIKKNGGKNILGIKLFKDEDLDSLMSNNRAINNLILEIKALRQASAMGGQAGFDGLNVDFEYQGNPTKVLDDKFLVFLKKMKEADLGEISLDVFANTIIKGQKEELQTLIANIDELVIMAYDFHRPGVDFVGPVAPIKSEVGERNILELVDIINSDNLERKKIIMAYPLYGYEWKTYTEEFGSAIKRGWYQMISWRRINELMKDEDFTKVATVNWDQASMSPWLVFKDGGQIHQIYYENLKSLGVKMDLVKQSNFGGVGFWALGYEENDKELWKMINQ
jgi:spore germination protein YaaH